MAATPPITGSVATAANPHVFAGRGGSHYSGYSKGKAAIDANTGNSLGDSGEFTDALADLPDDRLGTFYTVPRNLLAAIPPDEFDVGARATIENVVGENLRSAGGDLVVTMLVSDDRCLGVTHPDDVPLLHETLPGPAW